MPILPLQNVSSGVIDVTQKGLSTGSGTVTQISAGSGIVVTPNPITATGNVAIGSVLTSDWDAGTHTVTSDKFSANTLAVNATTQTAKAEIKYATTDTLDFSGIHPGVRTFAVADGSVGSPVTEAVSTEFHQRIDGSDLTTSNLGSFFFLSRKVSGKGGLQGIFSLVDGVGGDKTLDAGHIGVTSYNIVNPFSAPTGTWNNFAYWGVAYRYQLHTRAIGMELDTINDAGADAFWSASVAQDPDANVNSTIGIAINCGGANKNSVALTFQGSGTDADLWQTGIFFPNHGIGTYAIDAGSLANTKVPLRIASGSRIKARDAADSADVTLLTALEASNVAVGDGALSTLSSGTSDVAVGQNAGSGITSGYQNVAIGGDTLTVTMTTTANTAVGHAALKLTTGGGNTGVGWVALFNNSSGGNNTAVGNQSLKLNTTAGGNTAVGYFALGSTQTGGNNVALGYCAGRYETASDAFYVDNQDRTSTAGDKAGAILYGTFNATPANQTLKVNAKVGVGTAASGTSQLLVYGTVELASGSGGGVKFADGTVQYTSAIVGSGFVPTSRLINTTAPLAGGGDLTADRTLSIAITTTNDGGAIVKQSSSPGTQQTTANFNINGTAVIGTQLQAGTIPGGETSPHPVFVRLDQGPGGGSIWTAVDIQNKDSTGRAGVNLQSSGATGYLRIASASYSGVGVNQASAVSLVADANNTNGLGLCAQASAPIRFYSGGVGTANAIGQFDTLGLKLFSTGQLGWSASDMSGAYDTILTRRAAAVVNHGAADAASPIAQTISTQGSRAGTDTNIGGGGLTIKSGIGTGTGTPSALALQVPVGVASGTGTQTATTVLQFTGALQNVIPIGTTANSWLQLTRGRKRMTSSPTNATTTLSSGVLSDLTVTLEAARKYTGRMVIYASDSVAAEGIKFDFNGGTATMTNFEAYAHTSASTPPTIGALESTSLAGVINWTSTGITGNVLYVFELSLNVNAAGTFIPRFAQNSHSTGTATVLLGSFLHLDDSAN